MKIAIFGRNKQFIERELKNHNLQLDHKNPNLVIVFGGDGTLLLAERIYPEVPKIFLRHSSLCNDCKNHDFSKILIQIKNREYKMKSEAKLIATVKNKKLPNSFNNDYKNIVGEICKIIGDNRVEREDIPKYFKANTLF